jgi:hypothetical protein
MIDHLKKYSQQKKKFLRETSDILENDEKITDYIIQIIHVYTIYLCVSLIYSKNKNNNKKLNENFFSNLKKRIHF